MIIKNKADLATSGLRRQALDIAEAGIERVLPSNIMQSALSSNAKKKILTIQGDEYSLSGGRVFVIGGGKASGAMTEALEAILPSESITAGVVNVKGGEYHTKKVKIVFAGHPVPDGCGVDGVEAMLLLKQLYDIDEKDLVICLISGGGSALMPYPAADITLEDKQQVTRLLLASGAEIAEINIVRKHLSRVKGGQLGRHFAPATVVSLILSDVVGNDLASIASAPTVPDPSTFSAAWQVLAKYRLIEKLPSNVVSYLEKGCRGEVPETPKILSNCRSYIIGDNHLALEAMAVKARELGLRPYIITSEQKGDTTLVSQSRAQEILQGKYASYDTILLGGETTPILPPSPGRGGRNQHYAAVSLLALRDHPGDWVLASLGTDGSDFVPEVAGAIVDNKSLWQAQAKGLDVDDYLARYDSNSLLRELGGCLVETGDTGTNVGDVIIYRLSSAKLG